MARAGGNPLDSSRCDRFQSFGSAAGRFWVASLPSRVRQFLIKCVLASFQGPASFSQSAAFPAIFLGRRLSFHLKALCLN